MSRDPGPDDLARLAAGEPSKPLNTPGSTEGTVKWWRSDKGYGAVASAETAPWDIWCPFSAVEMPGFKALVPGDRVHVEYRRANQESFRYVASKARRLTAGGA